MISLEQHAPSALTSSPSLTLVKPSYGFVNTNEIVTSFARQGWEVASAKQARVNNPDKQGYQKHLLRFRHPNFRVIEGLRQYNESIPELIVENSHDATSSLKLFFGVFRVACLNGIIAGSALTHFRIIHSKNSITHLGEAIESMTFNVPDLIAKVQHFSNIELSNEKRRQVALHAANLRLRHIKNISNIEYDAVYRPKRLDDVNKDAYSIFNVIQEKVIKGGISYRQENITTSQYDRRTTRPITSVNQSIKLNRELWNILESVAV